MANIQNRAAGLRGHATPEFVFQRHLFDWRLKYLRMRKGGAGGSGVFLWTYSHSKALFFTSAQKCQLIPPLVIMIRQYLRRFGSHDCSRWRSSHVFTHISPPLASERDVSMSKLFEHVTLYHWVNDSAADIISLINQSSSSRCSVCSPSNACTADCTLLIIGLKKTKKNERHIHRLYMHLWHLAHSC